MQEKHTPGPWVAEWIPSGKKRDLLRLSVTAGKYIIASPIRSAHHDGENMHNATLIAAAPELLKALEEAVGDYEDEFGVEAGQVPNWYAHALSAITKAKGVRA